MHLEWPWNREPAAKEVVDRRNEEGHPRNIAPRRFPRRRAFPENFQPESRPDWRSIDPKGDRASVGVATPIAPHTFTYTSCECVFFSRWCKRCMCVFCHSPWPREKETDGERRWKSSRREREGIALREMCFVVYWKLQELYEIAATRRSNVTESATLNFMCSIGVIFTC